MRADSPSISNVGEVIAGRFEIIKPLARGSMGQVYLAMQHPLERRVALKVLDVRGQLELEGFDVRFHREAAVLARLAHPNTVRIYDHGREGDTVFLAMEYVSGPTLRQLIKREAPMEPVRAFHLVRRVAAALQEAHGFDIVHRDLKPANIMVSRSDGVETPKVLDFGLVKLCGESTETTSSDVVMGTPNYMAPEQINGIQVDGRCDLYALGIILFQLLTGIHPFKVGSKAEILTAHLGREPTPLAELRPELPPCVGWTIARALEKHPDDRFADMRQLAAALNACEIAVASPSHADLSIGLERGITRLPDAIAPLDKGFAGALVPTEPLARAVRLAEASSGRASMLRGLLLGVILMSFGSAVLFAFGVVLLIGFGWTRPSTPVAEPTPVSAPPVTSEPVAPEPAIEPVPAEPVVEPEPVAEPDPVVEPRPRPRLRPRPVRPAPKPDELLLTPPPLGRER